MMNKRINQFGMAAGIVSLLVLGACGEDKSATSTEIAQSMEPIEAELTVPKTVDLEQTVKLSVRVTQEEEPVDDADEVKFEVWKNDSKEESKMVKARLTSDGVYEADASFSTDGIYTVQSHVTARALHTMPTQLITVGHPEAEDAEAEGTNDDHHHHHSSAEITLEPTEAIVNEEQSFTVGVDLEEGALEGADVQLEIIREGVEKHEWVKLEEAESGTYSGTHLFEETGTYEVQIHVTKGHELHEHVMETIEVN